MIDFSNFFAIRLYCSVVVDVFKVELYSKFGFFELEDCLNVICDYRNVSDDVVLSFINYLKLVMIDKVCFLINK